MPVFSPLEITLFLILLAASAYGFWRRFGKVVRTIRASKPDAGFHLHPLPARIRDFISEVMLQSKVIRERPLPGLAHALVFWGFCAFALVTLNHLAAGIGLPFLSRASWFGSFYFAFAAVFAVAVAVAILGLFLRRFLVRPRWLARKAAGEKASSSRRSSTC